MSQFDLTDSDDAVRWLLWFAYLDLDKIAPEEQSNLIVDFFEFSESQVAVPSTKKKRRRQKRNKIVGFEQPVYLAGSKVRQPIRHVQLAQKQLRRGLDRLKKGGTWVVTYPSKIRFGVDISTVPDHELDLTSMRSRNPFRPLTKVFPGRRPEAFFVPRAAEAIFEAWKHCRTCENPECRAVFLPRRPNQHYCKEACSNRRRWLTHMPKRGGRRRAKKK